MSDLIPLSTEAVSWLRCLAQGHDQTENWNTAEPPSAYEELLAMGVVEYRPPAFRLTDIGWWALNRIVVTGES